MVKIKCKCCNEEFESESESNVFTISRSENFSKALFMPIDLINTSLGYFERQKLIDYEINKLSIFNNLGYESITRQTRFADFIEGWNYVLENSSEGLVIRNDREFYKVKLLHESKMPIIAHEKGKDKGTFILENNNRVSGTSESFVLTYQTIKAKGKIPMCEIEYPFITKDGKFFQPRLRRVYEDE